jgi:hypothetical protein
MYFTQSSSYFEDLISADSYSLSDSVLRSQKWLMAKRKGSRASGEPWEAKMLISANVDTTNDELRTGITSYLHWGTDYYEAHRLWIIPRSLTSEIGAKVIIDGLVSTGGPLDVGFDTADREDYSSGTMMYKNSKMYIFDGTDWHPIMVGSAEDPWA